MTTKPIEWLDPRLILCIGAHGLVSGKAPPKAAPPVEVAPEPAPAGKIKSKKRVVDHHGDAFRLPHTAGYRWILLDTAGKYAEPPSGGSRRSVNDDYRSAAYRRIPLTRRGLDDPELHEFTGWDVGLDEEAWGAHRSSGAGAVSCTRRLSVLFHPRGG